MPELSELTDSFRFNSHCPIYYMIVRTLHNGNRKNVNFELRNLNSELGKFSFRQPLFLYNKYEGNHVNILPHFTIQMPNEDHKVSNQSGIYYSSVCSFIRKLRLEIEICQRDNNPTQKRK